MQVSFWQPTGSVPGGLLFDSLATLGNIQLVYLLSGYVSCLFYCDPEILQMGVVNSVCI